MNWNNYLKLLKLEAGEQSFPKSRKTPIKDVTVYGLLACNPEITPQPEIFSHLICDSALPPKILHEYASGSNIPQPTVYLGWPKKAKSKAPTNRNST